VGAFLLVTLYLVCKSIVAKPPALDKTANIKYI